VLMNPWRLSAVWTRTPGSIKKRGPMARARPVQQSMNDTGRTMWLRQPASSGNIADASRVDRLRGKDLIGQDTVLDIDYAVLPHFNPVDNMFTVRLNKSAHFVHAVVLAIGAGGLPAIRAPLPSPICSSACHVFDSLDKGILCNISKGTTSFVIGGGLASPQIAVMAVQRGSKVWLLVRRPLDVNHFNVNLDLVGKYKNMENSLSAEGDDGTCYAYLSRIPKTLTVGLRLSSYDQARARRWQCNSSLLSRLYGNTLNSANSACGLALASPPRNSARRPKH
jgi:hypothetical protein